MKQDSFKFSAPEKDNYSVDVSPQAVSLIPPSAMCVMVMYRGIS